MLLGLHWFRPFSSNCWKQYHARCSAHFWRMKKKALFISLHIVNWFRWKWVSFVKAELYVAHLEKRHTFFILWCKLCCIAVMIQECTNTLWRFVLSMFRPSSCCGRCFSHKLWGKCAKTNALKCSSGRYIAFKSVGWGRKAGTVEQMFGDGFWH